MSKKLSSADRAYINSSSESSRKIASKLGCGKSTVNDYRKRTNSVPNSNFKEIMSRPLVWQEDFMKDLAELYPQLKEASDDYYKGFSADLKWDDSKCGSFESVTGHDFKKFGEVVGIIGDTHLPYEHKDYLQFCIDTFKAQGVTRVIHIGDLIDNHSLSFHDSETSLSGARGEMIDAKARLKPWFDAFPNVTVIKGNHDRIPARQLKKIGLDPSTYMRRLSEVYEFPEGWKEEDSVFLDGVLYHHGETALGANGFRQDAQKRMTNTVTGHCHSNCGVSYTATDHRLVFGMAVGCGIDYSSMAFAYGKNFTAKPIVSCGGVYGGKNPAVFTMDLGTKP